jgi:hypothetical protein
MTASTVETSRPMKRIHSASDSLGRHVVAYDHRMIEKPLMTARKVPT